MVIDMNEAKLTTLEQVRAFLVGTKAVEFSACGKDGDRYAHIAGVLHRFGYNRLKKADKGLILRYLERTTDYSRQQLTRIAKRWRTGKKLVKTYRAPKHGLVRKFTDADILCSASFFFEPSFRLARMTFCRMSLALAVQTKGLGFWLWRVMYCSMAAVSSGTLVNTPRCKRSVERLRKKRSTMFSHEAEVGVKWTWKRGCFSSHA
jgi:hypothetical protein